MKSNLRLFLFLALLEALWAPVNYMVVEAERGGCSPAGIGLIRWGGICLGVFLLLAIPKVREWSRSKFPGIKDTLKCIAIGLLLTGPSHLMYYTALEHTETVEGTVFNATSPLWVALFAGWILSEKVGPRRWSALSLGVVGAYIASVGFTWPQIHHGHLGWNLLYLGGALLECLGGALLARIIRTSSGVCAFAWETSGRVLAMILFPILLPAALPMRIAITQGPVLSLGYLMIIAGLFTFVSWVILIESAPLSLMAVTIALQTPIAAVLGHFYLHEVLDPTLFIGATIIFVSLLLSASEKIEPIRRRPSVVLGDSLRKEMPA